MGDLCHWVIYVLPAMQMNERPWKEASFREWLEGGGAGRELRVDRAGGAGLEPSPRRPGGPNGKRRLRKEEAQGQRAQYLGGLSSSCRRDCHSGVPISTFSRCFNSDGEGASAK